MLKVARIQALCCLQVQEFEHINGYYSMPEMIRKPVEPVKVEGVGDAATGTSSTSATPATSNAPSPSPAATPTPISTCTNNETKTNSDSSEVKECRDESKDKEVCIRWIKFSPFEILFICSEKQILISLPVNTC